MGRGDDKHFWEEANDNRPVDRSGLINQALRASSAAAEKGLWPLAALFQEWARQLNSGSRRANLADMQPAYRVMTSDDGQSTVLGAWEKTVPRKN